MSKLFLSVFNMSIAASWLVLAVLLLRLVLKKAPKWLTVALWAVVAVRLICPVSVESNVSLIPSAQTIPPTIMTDAVPEIHSGIQVFNSAVNPVLQESFVPVADANRNSLQDWISLAAIVWAVGVLAMLVYGVLSYLRVKRRVRTAVLLRDNLYQSEAVASPFVLGFLRPRIYLPFGIDSADMAHVIAHEQAHIRRKDHWWKPVGFAILALHWFNPLMWLGYVLLCRDIELACDEKVVKTLGAAERADYSQALLHCSVGRRTIAACPLAFGEVSVKDRVKSVLSYKKPAFWILLVGLVLSIVLAVCFLTNPHEESTPTESVSESDAPTTEEPTIHTDRVESLDIKHLREKFPMYFDLGTFKGLEVYIWQMAEGSYSCGVLPGVNRNYSRKEILALHKNSASLEEMQAIIAYYLEEGLAVKEDITLVPVTMPHSSYHYTINEAYTARLNALFWSSTILPADKSFYYYTPAIDDASFDIDGDGKVEYCILNYGPTSGIFTFTITAFENGEPEYFNIFTCPWTTLRFEITEEGQGILAQGDGVEQTYLSMAVEDGNIVIFSDAQDIVLWGEQGLDSPFAFRWLDGYFDSGPIMTVEGDFRTYYLNSDGTWQYNGYIYKHRLVIQGRMPNSEAVTTYVYLSNIEDISFERAMWASGISSHMNDYFAPEEAVLVDIKTEVVPSNIEIVRNDDLTCSYTVTDRQGNVLFQKKQAAREPKVLQVSENVYGLVTQTGTGRSTNWAVFCDIENGKTSDIFYYVLDAKDGYVLCGTHANGMQSVVLQDIFDPSRYTEVFTFEDASPTVAADCILSGELLDKRSALIQYHVGEIPSLREAVIPFP